MSGNWLWINLNSELKICKYQRSKDLKWSSKQRSWGKKINISKTELTIFMKEIIWKDGESGSIKCVSDGAIWFLCWGGTTCISLSLYKGSDCSGEGIMLWAIAVTNSSEEEFYFPLWAGEIPCPLMFDLEESQLNMSMSWNPYYAGLEEE